MEAMSYYCMLAYALITITIQLPSSEAKIPTSLATDQTTLVLKSHITSDPSRILATNWTDSISVCSWHGVTCSSRHQRVAALNLSYMSLSGTIPPQLGRLSFLVSLDLTANFFIGNLPPAMSLLRRLKFISLRLNNFTGDIPPLFGQLPNLKYLNLRNNSFIGSIPRFLSNLTNLQFLDLTSNPLSGEIPSELGRLQNLQILKIQINQLSGAIPPTIFNMSNLVLLAFAMNGLEGSLPTDMCSKLPFLAEVYLSNNYLSGAIPANLSQCSRLGLLSLSYNSFSGQIPAEIGYLTSLQILHLGGNNLNGTLAREIGYLQRLYVIGLERNQIGGSIDFNIFMNMSSIQQIVVWRNNFIGGLSRNVGNLTNITSLQITENFLTGVIPKEIGQLNQLEKLHLETNSLEGLIPYELFNISTLRSLALSFNVLSGVLPTHLCNGSPILEGLLLGMNSITGSIPNSISNCSQLQILTLYRNKLSGYIPTDLGNLRLVEIIDLSSNKLTTAPSNPLSSVITSLTNCRLLTFLSVADNPLYGTIPPSVGNLSSSVRELDTQYCKLSGGIPVQIGNISGLVSLKLYRNELSGNIPLTIKHLHELQGLFLYDNMLGGSIPEAICNLYNLNTMDATGNRLSGQIPSCLQNVSSLRHILLSSNMLSASIPSSVWSLEDLITLDLSSNSLSGFLPREISNLGAAIYINLSMNQLSHSIPDTLGKLENLVDLSLANNRLEGSIPVSMGSMISLVTFDISYNNLSGSIPKSLESLKHLNNFNVSYNSLSGEIPSGGSFRNFTMDSFMGNQALCGIPKFHLRTCPPPNHGSRGKKVQLIAPFVALGVVAFISVVSSIFFIVKCKRKDKTTREADELISILPERISYYELRQATEQFSNLLGTGSSCSVYKGVLNNGKVIAAKVFNMQLEGISRRFDVECEILRNIRHRNLTSVISSCSNEEFKALVLEYMPKGNLDKWLYSQNYCLNVIERLNIMIDVASALEYLHHGNSTPIIHSDLKPSNILLDEDMVAHVSDFGISKLLGDENSFVLTDTLATLGYIAPEYGLEGLVSTRCDVYSYGVLLMETFTRKRPSDDMFNGDLSLKRWVEISLQKMPKEVIDVNLVMKWDEEEYEKNMPCLTSILELALKCSAESAADRINMKEAHAELEKIKRQFS